MHNRRPILEQRSRAMKHSPTPAESALFQRLRAGKLGTRFRRQAIICGFIVDLIAPARRLIVEVDGGYHASRRAADARRDRKLARLGYRVLRLPEALVREQLEDAVALVVAALAEPP
jgi:very-short-patch-repair endonuclease